MKRCILVVLIASALCAQTAIGDIKNYAPYSVALVPPGEGEVIFPIMNNDNKLAFVPLSEVQSSLKENRKLGRPISYGEMIALIGDLQIQVDQLKQENEKLWAIAGKPAAPSTVVVQPTPARDERADQFAQYLLLRQLFPPETHHLEAARPVFAPQAPMRQPMHCTSNTYAGQTQTSCY